MDKTIRPIERLCGEVSLPGDKSISHRVVFIGSISRGKTTGKNFLRAEDCLNTVSAFKAMGIDIEADKKRVTIMGKGLNGLEKPEEELYLGNSGTTMRILPGILAGQDFEAILTGDESLSKRPMDRIIAPLQKMGVGICSKSIEGFPPLVIKGGKVTPLDCSINVASAQVKSCVLFAGLYADGVTSVTEPFLSRDHTERMLASCGAKISRKGFTVSIEGKPSLRGMEFFVPGDISSAAFLIAGAAILEGSDITIKEVGLNPTRLGFLNALLGMGADIRVHNRKETVEPYGDIRLRYARLKSVVVEKKDVPLLIDEIPVLAVVASTVEGRTVIKGCSELRVKETDRIFALTENLRRIGAEIRTEGEDIIIEGKRGRFNNAILKSYTDHRTAMSMAIASLYADGDCRIEDVDCVNTSFPEFFEMLDHLKK
ncbi:MAG: 3-phosphoshikimate 1-carboxyvinyltransferase [Omnitrophica bacterium RBG_13_46_9]|nr:MAG: 3-phosphoshikimate 1-carboxyvinyltransferase [Omnitrophica bacterium RBG_13_46_9]